MNTLGTISIQWLTTAAAIPETLWQQAFPNTVEGPWWYHALERSHLEDQFTFFYGLITADGKPIGVAPAFLMNVPIDIVTPPPVTAILLALARFAPSLRYQRTLFIGSPCSDEGTIGLIPGITLTQISRALQDALETLAQKLGANMLVWKDLLDADIAQLQRLIEARNLFTIPSFPGTCVSLPQGNFDQYLASLSQSHRYHLRKKLKSSRGMGPLNAAVIQHPGDTERAEIFGLFMQTYNKGKTKFERLGPAFFTQIAACPQSYFVTLRTPHDNRMVAFMLLFDLGKTAINKFIGIDYAMDPKWFMYFRLWEQAVIWAMQRGVTELQSGQTGYRAKLDMGHSLVPLTNVCINLNPLLHHIFALVAGTVDWASLDHDLKVYLDAQARRADNDSSP